MSARDSRLEAAYAHCEALTRRQAANFYYGIRLLSGGRRRAMCAVYAFSREVDDIGDGGLEDAEKLRRLDAIEASLSALGEGTALAPGDEVMLALADACRRFPIPLDALRDLIEGVRMDVRGVSYERFEELVLYCRRVAGAVGRVCLAIFSMREGEQPDRAAAESLADDLGVALQLTNILRDVREDAENGRVYLPYEDLRRFGVIDPQAGRTAGAEDGGASRRLATLAHAAAGEAPGAATDESLEQLSELVRFEADRAREWFARGGQLAPLLDRRSAACLLAMAGIYRRLLDRIDAQPLQAVAERMSLPAREKAWVAARGLLGAPL